MDEFILGVGDGSAVTLQELHYQGAPDRSSLNAIYEGSLSGYAFSFCVSNNSAVGTCNQNVWRFTEKNKLGCEYVYDDATTALVVFLSDGVPRCKLKLRVSEKLAAVEYGGNTKSEALE